MELQIILNAIIRIEADLVLMKQYLSQQNKAKQETKPGQKQLTMGRVTRMLDQQKVLDKRRAEEMFRTRKEVVERKLKLLKRNNE
jgi:hypothetical protein